jgi:ribosomal protein L11 methyltransferase
LIRLAIRCRTELAEQVLAELIELVPSGVEERQDDDHVELAIYGPPGELPALPDLEAAAGDALIGVSSTEVSDDWDDRWRDFHRPVTVAGGRIVVRPPWAEAAAAPNPPAPVPTSTANPHPAAIQREECVGGMVVLVDPGRAFGTGAHATTRLCLELLVDLVDADGAGGPLVDLGTGSGVLAIAAAKLGWSPVTGVDSELEALDAARANAAANRVDVELRRVNLRLETPPIAPTVVANLTAPLLVEVAARLGELPQALVCSGMLVAEVDRVADAFQVAGLGMSDRRIDGDWAAARFVPASA